MPPRTIVLLLVALTTTVVFAGESAKPNIVFVLTDDQGYGDISAHGNPVLQTPNMDRLRAQSVRFTDFHVSPTCSPTRSALHTGRHEFKNGVTHTILERERLTLDATTIAQVLKTAGYTTGIFGKWHLGDEDDHQPGRRGYDEVFIIGGGGIGQTYPGSCGDAPGNTYFDPAIRHNGKFEKTKGYCTDLFFAQAMKWIDAVKGRQPFYAYIATNAPHAPLQVRPEDEARYADKVDANTAKYFGMVANIDDNLGKLLEHLRALGLEQNTLVVFMNDNGGTGGVRVFNDGMRGQKGTPWLGGTRAASFWRWPGKFAPADCHHLAAHIDFFPTIAEIAGAKLTPAVQKQVEGHSLLNDLIEPGAGWPRVPGAYERTLFTHVGRWPRFSDPDQAKFTNCSVRMGRWHLVSTRGGAQPAWELYDVDTDHGEQKDVAAEHPDIVKKMSADYDTWWREARPLMVNEKAIGPKLNPFKEAYWKQFGGGPTEEDYRIMDPSQKEAPKEGKKKKKG